MASTIQKIPNTISSRLSGLRRQLTTWIVVNGLGRWLVIILAVLAIDFLIDRAFRMDFAQRCVMLALMVVIAIVFLFLRLIKPLAKRPADDALLLAVEGQNPDAKESMISSYQLARERQRGEQASAGVSEQLTDETILRGARVAEDVDFSSALDKSKHAGSWALFIAGLVLTGLLAWGVVATPFMQTWFNRNILLGDDLWPQSTYLEIVGARGGRIALPVGVSHRQLIRVTTESSFQNVQVNLEIESSNSTASHRMTPNGKLDGREHEFSFYPSAARMRAIGGDDRTGWVEIDLVTPPMIDELQITALMPEYTGLDPEPLVGTGRHSVLTGSRLSVEVTANKPLESCELNLGEQRFALQAVEGDNDGDAGGGQESGLKYRVVLPQTADDGKVNEPDGLQLAGGEYEFRLVDASGLANMRPTRFAISIKDDLPPKVRAEKSGVSNKVVADAVVPVKFAAMDEYGLTRIYYDCSWTNTEYDPVNADAVGENDDREDGANPGGANPQQGGNTITRQIAVPDFKYKPGDNIRAVDKRQRFELSQLELEPGMVLRFAVAAEDNCPNQPGSARADEFILQIVTPEELRADLLRREIKQRQAFEQAYNAQLALTSELAGAVAMSAAGIEGAGVEEERDDDSIDARTLEARRETRLISIAREQKQIGTRIANIAGRFEEFLEEVRNNGLDQEANDENEGAGENEIEKRYTGEIIGPISEIDKQFVSRAGRHLENCRRNSANPDELETAAAAARAVQEEILVRMKAILDSMMDSENYQEAINRALEVKAMEQRMIDAINRLNDPDDVLDPDDEDDLFDK